MVRSELPHFLPLQEWKRGSSYELRINDENSSWPINYRMDDDAIIIFEVFKKKTQQTPKQLLDICKKRIREYDNA
jgi:phage-related protein